MLSRLPGRLLLWILVPLAAGALSRAADATAHLRELAAESGQGRPLMRIGLEAARKVELASTGPFRVIDPSTGKDLWKPEYGETLRVITEGGPPGEVATIYRIQVGAFADRAAAEQEQRRLERRFAVTGVVRHDADRGNWRVRLGGASDRMALSPLLDRMRGEGLRDLWIAEEIGDEVEGVALRLVDERYDSHVADLDRVAVVPGPGRRIEVDGRPYRGVIELRVNSAGLIRPINWIELEQYLRGVVPAELGPEVWPQLEALKAQSVAARTYAWRNRGQFAEGGFDLCATPRCQVYGGVAAEHPLSDRAVAATRGELMVWKGKPIDALYTATCGGHTEDGSAVFPDQSDPYLRGVPCRAENEALASLRATIRGQEIEPLTDETGEEVTRDWSLLRAAGVIDSEPEESGAPREAVAPATFRKWTSRLARLAGLAVPDGPPPDVGTLGRAAAALLAELGWSERPEVLLSHADSQALLRDPEAAALPENERRALAYLAWTEGLRPFPGGRFRVGQPPSGARLAPALVRIGSTYRAFGLREAVVSGVGKKSIRLVQGKGELRLPLAKQPRLFGLSGGKSVPASRLELWPGDRVRFRTGGSGAIDFLELMPPVKGISDDRSAAVYSWEVRRTRRELEAAINRRVSIGRLEDLQVVRRGVSGRVVELRVVGSKGTTTVRGFDVRRLLDLRESLMVIEIQRDERGRPEAVVFAGKGWGHGVGLCQVGAYGMALRGASYRDILAHYYSGVSLKRLSGKDS